MKLFDFSASGVPDIGYRLTSPSGQSYTLKNHKTYTKQDGTDGVFLTWASECAECGTPIETTSGRASNGLNRRCDAHKAASIPANLTAAQRQTLARKAYGDRMKGYYAEYVAARDGEIPERITRITDGAELRADGLTMLAHAKTNARKLYLFECGRAPDGSLTLLSRKLDEKVFEPFLPEIERMLDQLIALREAELAKALFS